MRGGRLLGACGTRESRREYIPGKCDVLKKQYASRDLVAAVRQQDLVLATRHSLLPTHYRYGCYGAKEQPLWPGVTRRNGIPSLVVVGPDGACTRNGKSVVGTHAIEQASMYVKVPQHA